VMESNTCRIAIPTWWSTLTTFENNERNSALGQKRSSHPSNPTSAMLSEADVPWVCRHVANGPQADIKPRLSSRYAERKQKDRLAAVPPISEVLLITGLREP
jgi:hypothetical protein